MCILKLMLSPCWRQPLEAGELDEIQLLKLQLKSALAEMEGASVTGRAQGNKNAVLIQQRLDEIYERNSKTEVNIESISNQLDAHLFGISIEEVKRLEIEYNPHLQKKEKELPEATK